MKVGDKVEFEGKEHQVVNIFTYKEKGDAAVLKPLAAIRMSHFIVAWINDCTPLKDKTPLCDATTEQLVGELSKRKNTKVEPILCGERYSIARRFSLACCSMGGDGPATIIVVPS